MRKLALFLFIGLAIRLLLVPIPGFEADVAYWKSWSLAAADKGIVWLTYNTNYNYPAGFALVLWSVGKIYSLFADPNNFVEYWQTNNFLYLLLIKLPAILADLGATVIIWKLVKPAKLALPLALVYLFHPVVLFDGAWWGQVDSLLVVFLLLALLLLGQKRPVLASVMLTIGFCLKMQAMIFLPLFFLFVWRKYSWPGFFKGALAAAATYLALAFPFLFSGHLERTIYLIRQNADWFPVLSLCAFNLWWLVSWGKGLVTSDKILVLGSLNAKTVGLLLFSVSYLVASLLILAKATWRHLLFSFFFVGFAFFLFPTQSHDRYLFPSLIVALLFLPIFWETRWRKAAIFYFILLSLSVLLNLNWSMGDEYPANVIPVLSELNYPFLGIFLSGVNLLLFLVSPIFLCLKTSKHSS